MKATIEKINGKWTVNGKELSELSILEIGLLNSFFKAYKQQIYIYIPKIENNLLKLIKTAKKWKFTLTKNLRK